METTTMDASLPTEFCLDTRLFEWNLLTVMRAMDPSLNESERAALCALAIVEMADKRRGRCLGHGTPAMALAWLLGVPLKQLDDRFARFIRAGIVRRFPEES